MEYPDWSWTVATLRIPAAEPAGQRSLELRVGGTILPFAANVTSQRSATTTFNTQVTAQYRGTFADTGAQFDAGNFPLKLGQGKAVPGFDLGLLGLRFGEPATLVIPPPMGYGYDPDAGHAKFGGKTLNFEVKIVSMAN
jgi:FKBP-type peptidyl-prolyl cis-trans isomerase